METTKIIKHNSIQTKRLEKIIDAEHKLIQVENSNAEKNWLFYTTEEKAQWLEKRASTIKRLTTEIENLQEKYINNSFIN